MPDTYRVGFSTSRGKGSVEVTVPDAVDPYEHLANEIARELDLMRFEVQIGSDGGHIRLIGDDGPGTAFTLNRLDSKDS